MTGASVVLVVPAHTQQIKGRHTPLQLVPLRKPAAHPKTAGRSVPMFACPSPRFGADRPPPTGHRDPSDGIRTHDDQAFFSCPCFACPAEYRYLRLPLDLTPRRSHSSQDHYTVTRLDFRTDKPFIGVADGGHPCRAPLAGPIDWPGDRTTRGRPVFLSASLTAAADR